jgi:carbon storage regulator
MLVLSRKPGEAVVIGDNVRLTVVAIRGSRVRLGITAPVETPIRREERCRAVDGCNQPYPSGAVRVPKGTCRTGPPEVGR